MLSQLLTLVWLRLLLLRRTLFRSAGGFVAALLVAAFTVGLVLFCMAVGVAVFVGSLTLAGTDDPFALLLVADAVLGVVLVLWAAGMLSELQRSDVVDFRKMLYLPVRLRMIFLLNFGVSLASPLFVLFIFIALGATGGFAVGAGPRMLWLLPLSAAFYLALMAWTYHLRGLLGALMENKRRRRLILALIPVVFILVAQAPNLFIHFMRPERDRGAAPQENLALTQEEAQARLAATLAEARSRHEAIRRKVTLANAVLPPGWLPTALVALREGDYGVAAQCLLGLGGIAGLGLALGYRSTLSYYTGTRRRGAAPRAKEGRTGSVSKRPLTSRALPLLSDDTSAVAMASWLTAIRHPRVRVQLIMPLVIGLFFLAIFLSRQQEGVAPLQAAWALPAVVFWLMLNCAPFLFNSFGLDPEGFQAFVLLPTPRARYLAGKNLAFFPLLGLVFVLMVTVTAVVTRPSLDIVAVSVLQFTQIYLTMCILGNVLSVYFPYRLRKDSMNTAKFNPRLFLVGVGTMVLLPFAMLPTLVCYGLVLYGSYLGDWGRWPLGEIASPAMTMLTFLVYRATLEPISRCLMRREQAILALLQYDRD